MRIPLLEIQNFMGIGQAKLALDDKGLVLVQGENLDDTSAESNGAGKSTTADALFWCFYGSTAREKLGADEVVNRTAKKDTVVTARVQEPDGSFYTIKRWRKLSGAPKKNGCSITFTNAAGAETDLTKGKDDLTQIEIDRALGCSQEVFTAAVYAGQDQLPNLPSMTDGELKKLIEEASGVTTLVRAYDIARGKLKDAERNHDVWRADHVRAEREVQTAQARLKELQGLRDGFEAKRKGEIAILKNDVQEAVERAKRRKLARDTVNVANVEARLKQLDAKINAVADEATEESRLFTVEREAHAKLVSARSRYNERADKARSQKAELDKINDRIGTPCTTCGKPYEEHDLEAAAKIAKDKVRETVTGAREIASDIEALQEMHKVAESALAAFRAQKTDVRETVEERKRLAETLAQRQRDDLGFANDTQQAQRIKAQLDAKLAESNPYVHLADTCQRELNEAVDAHAESGKHGADLERRVMVCKDVVKVFGPAGVRAHILDTVTPLLNDRTAQYLGTLSDGRISAIWSTLVPNAKGEMSEKFSITVEKDGDGGSHAALSGGEKRKVRLATALALQDLVASRATKPIGIWVGDEIDDALDDAGLERLMTLLETKARERGTVIVISHNSLNDWIRETATVTRKGGFSTVSGALDYV